MTNFNYIEETKSSDQQLEQRKKLYELFSERPLPDDQLLTNLGLYMRSSAVAKILFINELYEIIKDVPGVIMEFGTWWGQNLVLFENLRAIYEPFNQNRKIIGFDTFKGYPNISSKDKASKTIKVGGYTVCEGYKDYLTRLLAYHEGNNVLGNIKKSSLIEGDIAKTIFGYFSEHPETIVALAYIDVALYEPTRKCLEAIKPHLIKGSVVMFDELNSSDYPGETIAFKEVFHDMKLTLRQSRYMRDRTIAIVD
jgi:hypothetical protein